ncbi:RHS repeat-associated protein [Nocardioides daedukensis]|uniref:RHS repeat-associated protein n=1 Tax=Nocardioides daedukensis TaxID=634462 RepID=A0A7Y9UVS7_9ACTN|nr:RHS repeat-associated core domain-containing protein [Nocardioides daedukensis]NYG58755.1 RHS repeat-associated protein [Nocardioides daedukensis]
MTGVAASAAALTTASVARLATNSHDLNHQPGWRIATTDQAGSSWACARHTGDDAFGRPWACGSAYALTGLAFGNDGYDDPARTVPARRTGRIVRARAFRVNEDSSHVRAGGVGAKTTAKACSFAGTIVVLIADGTKKPIEEIVVRDHDVTCHRYDDHQRLAATWTPSTGDCATNPSQAGLGGPAPQWQGWTFNDRGLRATQSTTTPTTQSSETYTYPAVSDPHPNSVTTITTTGTAAGTRNYAYDESGNTTTRPDTTPGGAAQDLDWNAEGKLSQLVTERDGASATTTYLYGADGELLLQSNDTETVLFAAETEIHTDNDTGDLSAQRHYALPGGVSGVRASDTQLDFLLTNPAGTGTIALDGATLTPERNYTSPYGEQRGTKPPAWPTTRGFLGKPEDTDTGLTSVGARQYDPTTGRFISVDPLMDTGSPSQLLGYAYANNNPNTFTDPSGLYPIEPERTGNTNIHRVDNPAGQSNTPRPGSGSTMKPGRNTANPGQAMDASVSSGRSGPPTHCGKNGSVRNSV